MSNLDLAQLTELKDIMEDAFDELVSTYLDDSSVKLHALGDAINAQNSEDVASLAHSLKGSSSNVCAPGLAAKFKVLEDMGRSGDVSQAQGPYAEAKEAYANVEAEMKAL